MKVGPYRVPILWREKLGFYIFTYVKLKLDASPGGIKPLTL